MTAAARVQAARTALVLNQPFFGMLALQLHVVADPSCRTAWTDGKSIGYNPTFVDTLTDDQLQGLIAHEVMHCVCGHPWRRGARDHARFNEACDYAINPIITDAGMVLPDGALINPDYHGKYAEWIFDRLPAPAPEPEPSQDTSASGDPDGDPSGDPAPGEPEPAPGEVRDAPSDADAPTEADWQETTAQAAKIAEGYGKLPGSMQRDIANASKLPTDWSAVQRYVQEICNSDYTWTRPNARYLAGGLYLPSLRSVQCGRIVAAVDTSGSVDLVRLQQFGARLSDLMDLVQPSTLDVIYCDYNVQGTETFERGDVIMLHPVGGGGTRFEPVFEHVDASGDVPTVLIYLTDLDGSFPDAQPDYPVLWLVTDQTTAPSVPFGDVQLID